MSEATNSDQADADRAAESGRVQMDDHPTLDRLPESLLTASLDDASGRSPLESLPLRKLEQGDLIANRYQIRQQIGRGGFGDVFRATDRELQRDVAIKACNGLRSFVGGRIRVEAQAIASLNHPNIVSIFDLVKQGDQELLIVMEFLEGETFRELITQGNLQSQGIAECMLSVALALDHAHRRHLVHSDLKPGNLFRTTDGTVKLLDFGLAVAYVPGKPSSRLGGTPGYMAPEQIRGESHRIDGRTDIWAAGIVLFEWLTGVKPFVGSGAEQVARAALNEETPSPRSLNPAIDDELCRIVRKCLAKRMADRYQTGQDLADDLHHWLARHPSRGIGPASRTRPRSDAPRRLRSLGLQCFTEEDSDGFLALIPGPRDHDGVPDSLRFWLNWVDSEDPDTYPVAAKRH
ncbi:MAG: serine/threonine-protein kinase, partial [Planctomycetota bacterium]